MLTNQINPPKMYNAKHKGNKINKCIHKSTNNQNHNKSTILSMMSQIIPTRSRKFTLDAKNYFLLVYHVVFTRYIISSKGFFCFFLFAILDSHTQFQAYDLSYNDCDNLLHITAELKFLIGHIVLKELQSMYIQPLAFAWLGS